MTLTNSMCQEYYQRSVAVLKSLIASPQTPQDARARAQSRFEELNRDYLEWATSNIEKRTEAFTEFVGKMKGVFNLLKAAPLTAAVRRLRGLIDEGAKLLQEKEE